MPPRGGNRSSEICLSMSASFNSCPREGAIQVISAENTYRLEVSTHAPARGQSFILSTSSIKSIMFQLMPPRGGNHTDIELPCCLRRFNSCPREGAIKGNTMTYYYIIKFQLMPPRGGNHGRPCDRPEAGGVSTHAPARGQSLWEGRRLAYRMFQLMPPRGGNLFLIYGFAVALSVSTHAPARGQSPVCRCCGYPVKEFQLMPPRGGNPRLCVRPTVAVNVSTHAPARGQSRLKWTRRFAMFTFQLMPPRGGNRRAEYGLEEI